MSDMIQRSPEWYAIRCGKVTASKVNDIMTKVKSGGYGASRDNYMADIICERLTGKPTGGFTSDSMQWGVDNEAAARKEYGNITFNDVTEIGFVEHPVLKMAGCSPDGLVSTDGLIEIKCPNTNTHIDTLLSKKIDKKYNCQMQMQMDCTDRKWCDYVSYDPRLPEGMRIVIIRVNRDEEFLKLMRAEIKFFNDEVEKKIQQLKKLGA